MNERQMIALRGLPGSGKSRWVTRYEHEQHVCSADLFFEKRDFDPALLGEAHSACFRSALEECKRVYDRTRWIHLSRRPTRSPW